MADSLSAKYGSNHAKFAAIMKRFKWGRNNINRARHRVWVAAAADPAVDAGSQATYPVEIGDLAYRIDSDEVFVCSVAPAAATAATFIQCHA